MPVQSIECTLTQAQMKRYLAGADCPEEILVALERHLKVCPDCMEAASSQRQALGGAPITSAQAVVSAPAPTSPLGKVKALIPQKKGTSTPPESLVGTKGEDPFSDPLAAIKSPKNVVLSVSLALVLILMSTVLRNPTSLLGPRASAKISPSPAKETKAEESETVAKAEHSEEEATKPEVKSTKETEEKSAEPGKTREVKTHTTNLDSKPVKPTEHSEVKEPVKIASHTTNLDTKPTKPPVKETKLEKVGGNVVVAEAKPPVVAHAKPPVAKKPVAHSPAPTKKVVARKPRVKRGVRAKAAAPKPRAKTTRSTWQKPRIKVYQP